MDTVVVERCELRGLTRVFRDRAHDGATVAETLLALRGTDALVLGVPAGGVPVAVEVAGRLELELDGGDGNDIVSTRSRSAVRGEYQPAGRGGGPWTRA